MANGLFVPVLCALLQAVATPDDARVTTASAALNSTSPKGATPPLHYMSFDREIPLAMDETEVAILNETMDGEELQEALAGIGLPEFELKGELIPDSHLFARPGTASEAAAIQSFQPFGMVKRTMDAVLQMIADAGLGFPTPSMWIGSGADAERLWIRELATVRFKEGIPQGEAEFVINQVGTILEVDWNGTQREYLYRPTARTAIDILATANALAADERVEFSHPLTVIWVVPSGQTFPADPEFLARSWGLHNTGQLNPSLPDLDVNAPEGWFELGSKGSPNIAVLVMDTGIDPTHSDLAFTYGKDFTPQNPTGGGEPVNPCDNHGTWVAGVLHETGNGLATIGIAPGVTLASARVQSETGTPRNWPSESCVGYPFQWDNATAALQWANTDMDPGPAVVRASISTVSVNTNAESPSLATKYAETRAAGMLHFASAGNQGGAIRFPANLPSVNGVTNLDYAGSVPQLHFDSNRGPEADFTAPGVDIYTTDRSGAEGACPFLSAICPTGDDYAVVEGTSYSAPLLAGAAALVRSANPALDPATVEWLLARSARIAGGDFGTVGWDQFFGWGLPRLDTAIRIAKKVGPGLLFADDFESAAIYWSGVTP